MAYIGKEPQVGNYIKLDAISTSSTNSYSLTKDSVAFTPESALHMIVSLNGVIQAPLSSFSVSGSTITFLPSSGTLSSSDTIDFILVLGNVLDIGTPSDSTVTNAKTNFVSTSSSAGLQIKGDGTTDGTTGTLQLNCSNNNHGIKLASPAHTHGQNYTLTFPTTAPVADKFLKTDGSGNLSFASGIEEYDIWRITTNTTNTASAYISSNWERCDDAEFEKIGTGLSESSGVFSFPSTGKYLITAFVSIQARNGEVGQGQAFIYTTTDNSNYYNQAQAEMSGSSDHVISVSMSMLFDVTNISTHKIQLGLYTASNNLRALGSTTGNRTYITFMKIGET